MWTEGAVIVAQLRHEAVGTEENCEKAYAERRVCLPRVEPQTAKFQGQSVTAPYSIRGSDVAG
jgi:hypothetical protein